MTAAELIAKLQQVPGDTVIAVWSTHKQQTRAANRAVLIKVWDIEEAHLYEVDQEEQSEDTIYDQVFEIGAP